MDKMPSSVDEGGKKSLLRYARECAAAAVAGEGGRRLSPPSGLPPFVNEDMACFVTFRRRSDGALRGCIGNIEARGPLIDCVARNAVNSVLHDPRFPAVADTAELDGLDMEISILSPPEPIATPDEFMVGEHGIILRLDGHSAVFLPQVAPEQGWDRPATLSHLARKAGLPQDAWRSPRAEFQVFRALVLAED